MPTKLQPQGVYHVTGGSADRHTSVDFWQGVLGMPLVFEQPNLDHPEQNQLYFDPGEGAQPAVPITLPMSIWPTPSRKPAPAGKKGA